MTLVEVLVALVIALGVVASAIEASQMAISRSAIARLQTEAALDAEALLSRVGNDLPLGAGHLEGAELKGVHWAVDIVPVGQGEDPVRAYRVQSSVGITRAGTSAQIKLDTLKLQWTKR